MSSPLYLSPLVASLLVAARLYGLALTAPWLVARELPWQLRWLLPLALTLVVVPMQWSLGMTLPQTGGALALGLVGEAIVGALLGLGVMVLVAGAKAAGQLVGQMSGLTLAEVYDPGSDEATPLVSRLMYLLAMAVFMAMGGQRMLVAALLDSYVAIPLGTAAAPPAIAPLLASLCTESFSLALRAAAPAMLALLLSTLVIGMANRTLPQMNLLTVGLALNLLVGLGALILSAGAIAWLFQEQLEPGLEIILNSLRAQGSYG